MAIILVPQPGSAPTDVTDWEDSVETLKQYNLGVNSPVDYNFDDDTIKKGVLITIGGSNYYCNADTAITGTASDYVKVTSDGVATYVSSLSGVSWNDTYNFYADSSGNAYIFNEAKEGLANTKIGAFAEHGYFKLLTITGIATFAADAITLDQPVTIGASLNNSYTTEAYNIALGQIIHGTGTGEAVLTFIRDDATISDGDALGAIFFNGLDGGEQTGARIRTVSNQSWGTGSFGADLYFETYYLGTKYTPIVLSSGKTLLNGATDNGIDALQVNGSVSCDSVACDSVACDSVACDSVTTPSINATSRLRLNTALDAVYIRGASFSISTTQQALYDLLIPVFQPNKTFDGTFGAIGSYYDNGEQATNTVLYDKSLDAFTFGNVTARNGITSSVGYSGQVVGIA